MLGSAKDRRPWLFEWWYFHFVTETGPAINMVLHQTDIFGLKCSPYLSLSLLVPGQQPRYWRQSLATAQIARKGDLLSVGDGLVEETQDGISFDVPLAGEGSLSGHLTKLAGPLTICEGILREGEDRNRSHWIAQVPHACFSAWLRLDGGSHRLSGMAYQDHQWGRLPIQDFVSDWAWGQFSNPELAVVFLQIRAQSGDCIDRVGLVSGDRSSADTAVRSDYLDILSRQAVPAEFSHAPRLELFEGRARLGFEVGPATVMRSRLGEGHGPVTVDYLRWSTSGEIVEGSRPQTVYGVTEYLRIRRTATCLACPREQP